MKRLRPVLRFVLRSLVFIIGSVLLYGLLGCLLSILPVNRAWMEADEGPEVFVLSNGVHLDLVLPRYYEGEDLFPFLAGEDWLRAASPNAQHLAFGWGDKGFYLETPNWSDLKASVALKALFMPSETAIHLTAYRGPLQTGDHCRSFRVTPEQLADLVAYVKENFAFREAALKRIDCCQYGGAPNRFYEAEGSYHLVMTCNQWVNQALKRAGIRTAVWSPFDWGVLYHFEE